MFGGTVCTPTYILPVPTCVRPIRAAPQGKRNTPFDDFEAMDNIRKVARYVPW